MHGKIIKGIAGFYYVLTEEKRLYECRARGIFRQEKLKPLVGDDVSFDGASDDTGFITKIMPRKNELIRPAVANVDQAVLLFAFREPEPDLNLIDRFLIMMEIQDIPCILVFTKRDLESPVMYDKLMEVYKDTPYELRCISTIKDQGVSDLKALLSGKTSVLAGPSGVGKSTLVNALCPDAFMETGTVSEKIKRGRHTTRHSELFQIDTNTYIFDTPGFSSLSPDLVTCEELHLYMPEFKHEEDGCRFSGCVHVGERECGVKAAVADGRISTSRYDNYLKIYQELKERKRY